MATFAVDETNLQETVSKGGILLLDFWADWCVPCHSFAPIYEAASDANPDIAFGKVDTEAAPGLAQAAGISAIPTLMAFRDGVVVFAQAGALPRPALDDLITQIRGLDMDEVRAEAGAHPEHAPHNGANTDGVIQDFPRSGS